MEHTKVWINIYAFNHAYEITTLNNEQSLMNKNWND